MAVQRIDVMQAVPISLDLSPGTRYVCNPTGLTYRVLNTARQGRTLQEQVVYEGLEGDDEGRWFTCPLMDFAVRFTKVQEAREAAGPVKQALEKVTVHSEGPGC